MMTDDTTRTRKIRGEVTCAVALKRADDAHAQIGKVATEVHGRIGRVQRTLLAVAGAAILVLLGWLFLFEDRGARAGTLTEKVSQNEARSVKNDSEIDAIKASQADTRERITKIEGEVTKNTGQLEDLKQGQQKILDKLDDVREAPR